MYLNPNSCPQGLHISAIQFFNPLRFLYNLPKTPKKGIPKVNRMLFLGHLDDIHGVGLLWKVTLWGVFLNRITVSLTDIE